MIKAGKISAVNDDCLAVGDQVFHMGLRKIGSVRGFAVAPIGSNYHSIIVDFFFR